jgi:uncharacterized protein YqgQ
VNHFTTPHFHIILFKETENRFLKFENLEVYYGAILDKSDLGKAVNVFEKENQDGE